ncbi:hypothetical protein [Roseofilum capinflatum]|uniref:Porin n=1 Tax=Roseofilum capinflatum BLCC-M114 TaxID=3022440 RepID=A0ABT7B2N8_9CYAN|nr:hypothetical protein [Roseofilum capinflatum]MDJ1173092.1 hypothetical protein [Roseofilum capinflatum BLCC-M114]
MKTLFFWPVSAAIAWSAVFAFLSSPALSQEEEGVTLKGDSLQTVESRSTQDFPGLYTDSSVRIDPRLSTGRSRSVIPQVRLNEKVDVMYQDSAGSGEDLGLFRSPGDVRPSGTVNLRLQLEE